jgi:hypothetical protein
MPTLPFATMVMYTLELFSNVKSFLLAIAVSELFNGSAGLLARNALKRTSPKFDESDASFAVLVSAVKLRDHSELLVSLYPAKIGANCPSVAVPFET